MTGAGRGQTRTNALIEVIGRSMGGGPVDILHREAVSPFPGVDKSVGGIYLRILTSH